MLGTLGYLSPEQARARHGRPSRRHLRAAARCSTRWSRGGGRFVASRPPTPLRWSSSPALPARFRPRRRPGSGCRGSPLPRAGRRPALPVGARSRRGARVDLARRHARRGCRAARHRWVGRGDSLRQPQRRHRRPVLQRRAGRGPRPRPGPAAGLRVASRTSSFRFRGRELDVRRVGHELGVGAVLEGSVRRAGARLRLTVHLTSVEDGYHMWSEHYDRELADVFEVQDESSAPSSRRSRRRWSAGPAVRCGGPPPARMPTTST